MRLTTAFAVFGVLLASQASAADFPPKIGPNSVYLTQGLSRAYIDLDTGRAITEEESRITYPDHPPDPTVSAERQLSKAEISRIRRLLNSALDKGVHAPKSCESPPHRVIMLQASLAKKAFSGFVFCPLAQTEELNSAVWRSSHSAPADR